MSRNWWRLAGSGVVVLAATSLTFSVPAAAQPAAAKFCGGTVIEWATDVARSATDRMGNILTFGQPNATLRRAWAAAYRMAAGATAAQPS